MLQGYKKGTLLRAACLLIHKAALIGVSVPPEHHCLGQRPSQVLDLIVPFALLS